MSAIKISLRTISKVFDPALPAALNQVSLDITEGSLCVLMGLSGSGKSTLLRTINGLAPPTSGQVLIDGVDLATLAPRQLQRLRRDTMGMVFQSSALFPHLNVIDNAAFGLDIAGVSRAERTRRAAAMLDLVGLLPHARQYPHELSGGMRQRVGLARALAVKPSLLLMDEAFSALDPLKRRAMQEMLLAIQREQGLTVVFVSHDIDEALFLGQQIALLHHGHLLQQGTARTLLANPVNDHVRAFFHGADTASHLQASDLIDHDLGAPARGAVAAHAGALDYPATDIEADIESDTRLAALIPRLSQYRAPLTVRDATGAALGLITAASALRTISRASTRS